MIRFLLEKEFKQIKRNPFLPKLIIGFPVLMMLIMPWATNQEIKNINISLVDNDHSSYSERLIEKISASTYFHLMNILPNNNEALKSVEAGKTDVMLEIQPDFEKNIVTAGRTHVMISANAVNGVKGGLASSYLSGILRDYAEEIRAEQFPSSGLAALPVIDIRPQYRFNPYLDYKVFMVPALMVMLLTLLSGFLPALNMVSEKELGTIEQINVTPVPKFTFIMAKLIPYWVIGFLVLSISFGLAALIYGLFPAGNLGIVYLFAIIYVLGMSGFGMVISNYSSTMQQAMFVIFFFIIILILMSGLFTPVSSMPQWAQTITWFNPLKYFMQVMRLVYLKGSGIGQLIPPLLALLGFMLAFNLWAVLSYRKSS